MTTSSNQVHPDQARLIMIHVTTFALHGVYAHTESIMLQPLADVLMCRAG